MRPPSDARNAPEPSRPKHSIGTILLGGVITMFGLLWLFDIAGAIDSRWHAVLPGALIVIGLALVLASADGSHPGLIVLCSALTVVLAVSAAVDIPLSGGIGERVTQPATVAELESSYSLAIGQQVIDLRDIDFPAGETRIKARVGIGELVVKVPLGATVHISYSVGVGDASILDISRSGVGIDVDHSTPAYDATQQRLVLDVSVGVGSLVVRYVQ